MDKLAKNFLKEQRLSNKSLETLEDEFKDYAFKIYLYSYIKKTIVFSAMQIKKKANKIQKTEHLSLNVIDPDFNEERLDLIVDSQSNFAENIDMYDFMKDGNEIFYNEELLKAINSLTDRQKEVVYECIILEKTDSFVARELGITKQGVNKTKHTALSKLRKKLGA